MTIDDLTTRLAEPDAPQKTRRQTTNQKRKALAAEIETLCGDLENIIAKKSQTPALLLRQAHILDRLFLHMAGEAVESQINGGWGLQSDLTMALRLQEQCVDTIKARGAIQYMNALVVHNALPGGVPALPPPPQNDQGESE